MKEIFNRATECQGGCSTRVGGERRAGEGEKKLEKKGDFMKPKKGRGATCNTRGYKQRGGGRRAKRPSDLLIFPKKRGRKGGRG